MERIRNSEYRRLASFCIYFLFNFTMGFDLYSRSNQSIYYLKELNASYIPLYQGMLIAIGYGVGAIYGLLVGYFCDHYGHARRLFIISNVVGAIGTLIYSIPISAPVLLFGQFLNGFAKGSLTIVIAELARMYDGDILTRVFTWLNVGLALGLITGPLSNFAFVNIDIEWGWYYIHSTNAPGYVVLILYILLSISAVLFLQESEEINKNDAKELNNENSLLNTSSHKLSKKLKLLLGNKRLLLVYFGTFYWTFVLTGMEALVPLVAADWLGFKATQLSISYIASGGTYIVGNFGFAFVQRYINDFYSVILLSLLHLSVPGLVWLIHYLNMIGKSSLALYYTWVVIGSLTWILEDVLARAFCSKLVPLQLQGFAEGVRTVPKAIGLLGGGLFVSIWYEEINFFSPIILISSIILIIGFILQRKSYIELKRLSMS